MAQINWMNLFLFIFSGVAAVGGIWSAISARNSDRHAKESAEAAATSARIAKDALDLEKVKFNQQTSEVEQTLIQKIIDDGISLFEQKGHRTGMKRWIRLYPDLMRRDDFMKLFERVMGATGNSPLGAGHLLEVYKKEGIIP